MFPHIFPILQQNFTDLEEEPDGLTIGNDYLIINKEKKLLCIFLDYENRKIGKYKLLAHTPIEKDNSIKLNYILPTFPK
jgi:hypothetical protein